MSTNLGVEVIQQLATTPTSTTSPTLVPCVIGVCHQIIEALDTDGSLNSDAKYTDEQYNQAQLQITQAEFPDPRSNIDEIDIDETEVQAYLYAGGSLTNLPRGSNGTYAFGSSFLEAANLATAATIISSEKDSFAFGASPGSVLVLAIDQVNPTSTSSDVTVSLVGTLTTAETVAAINAAVGSTVAYAIAGDGTAPNGAGSYVGIRSRTYGAKSSVTLRAGTSALKILYGSSFDDSKEYRMVGAGFRGQDDSDSDLYTPWIEFNVGGYYEDSVATLNPGAATDEVWAGHTDLGGTFTAAAASAVTFAGSSPTIQLQAATSSTPGDEFWADGSQVGSAEVIRVETSRFKLGILNNSLSTFNSDGDATTRVYDTVEVNIITHPTPFAPQNAYFVANGLQFGSVTPEGTNATLTGTSTALDERSGYVQSSSAISFVSPLSLAGLTLNYVVTEDGVATSGTYTFTGGPFANLAAVVSHLTGKISNVTPVAGSTGHLVLQTTKTGSDQAISLLSTGTANSALNFSTASTTTGTGKDHEFAEQATITGSTISLPMAWMSSVTLELTIVDSMGTHAISASSVDLYDGGAVATMADLMAAISSALNGDGTSTINNIGIPVAEMSVTNSTEAYGALTITTIEGGASVSISVTATDGTDGFTYLGFYDDTNDEPAELTSVGDISGIFPYTAAGVNMQIDYDPGTGVVNLVDAAYASGPHADAAALAAALNANDDINGVNVVGSRSVQYVGDDTGGSVVIIVRSVLGGAAVTLQGNGIALDGSVNDSIQIYAAQSAVGSVSTGNTDDDGADSLKTTSLGFYLDSNPFQHTATFATNSLQDAIDDINTAVGGATDVASETAGKLTLTSQYAGSASKVEIGALGAETVFGLTGSNVGTGRPNPDFYLDGSGDVVIGANILRNTRTGEPYSLESAFADVYLAYTGIREDVSSLADDPSLLTFGDTETMEAAIGPISTDNPLALGCFLALSAAPSSNITALGVDEYSSAAPLGTIDGWVRALEFLESKEVYALAPLTDDAYVNGLVSTHVSSMSAYAKKGERIAFIWTDVPTRDNPTSVASGTDGETNGTDNSFTLDVNPGAALIAQGIDITGTIDADEGVYLEYLHVELGVSELRRYSVSAVSGVVLTLRTTFTGSDNSDGFYTTTTLDGGAGLDSQNWTLFIRGDQLLITSTTRTDRNAVANAAADEGDAYGNRRVFYLFGGSVDTSIDGLTTNVGLYYASAAIAGMVGENNPSQPFSQVPIPGIGAVYGTEDSFTQDQLWTIANGGRYVLINNGGTVVAMSQWSTDTSSLEYRELSITKAIDWLAKGIRSTNRVFTGRYNITPNFLDNLTMANEGFLSYAVEREVVRKTSLEELLQDTTDPDTILVEVLVTLFYPCNKIRITIVS